MLYKETQAELELEEHAHGFLYNLIELTYAYEENYELEQFVSLITNATDDSVQEIIVQLEALDKKDPNRSALMAQLLLADKRTGEAMSLSVMVQCMQTFPITLFQQEADKLAAKYAGSPNHSNLEDKSERQPSFEQQLIYSFEG
jgi:hypothetical protein